MCTNAVDPLGTTQPDGDGARGVLLRPQNP